MLSFGWLSLEVFSLWTTFVGAALLEFIVNASPMRLEDEESVDHLLLNCRLPQFLWRSVVRWFGCRRVLLKYLHNLFEAWKVAVGSTRGRFMWKASFFRDPMGHLDRA